MHLQKAHISSIMYYSSQKFYFAFTSVSNLKYISTKYLCQLMYIISCSILCTKRIFWLFIAYNMTLCHAKRRLRLVSLVSGFTAPFLARLTGLWSVPFGIRYLFRDPQNYQTDTIPKDNAEVGPFCIFIAQQHTYPVKNHNPFY